MNKKGTGVYYLAEYASGILINLIRSENQDYLVKKYIETINTYKMYKTTGLRIEFGELVFKAIASEEFKK